jgi:uncharacterized repeat protein (TIGR01451 family)
MQLPPVVRSPLNIQAAPGWELVSIKHFTLFSLTKIFFMQKQFYSVRSFFISLLLSIGIGVTVNGQTVEVSRENLTTGSDGANASAGDIMQYRITTSNGTPSNITSSTIYGNIPAGTLYVAGSTIVNGVAVSDVNGKMPFGSGGLINSPTAAPGVVAPNTAVVIEYNVQVGTNGGNFTNDATLKGTSTSGTVLVKSNTVSTAVDPDLTCTTIYQSTSSTSTQGGGLYPYRYIKSVITTTGVGGSNLFTPNSLCYNAVTGASIAAGAALTDGEAIAYDPASRRLYVINGTTNSPTQELCYIDVNTGKGYKFVGYPLETNTTTGYNIDRMAFCSDGYGYALTANAQDLIRFSIDPSTNLPVISRLGLLVNDANNGTSNDVLAETGGDLFSDGSGKLYLIPNSGKLYMINPATRIATYLGTIGGARPTSGVNAVATDMAGNVYIGGAFTNVYKVNLATMISESLNSTASNVWKTGDYASCSFPILAPTLKATKTYTNLNGAGTVRSGDPIEYTIEVTNTGNLSAALVKLYDAIPANSIYIANSTTMNGVAVTDIGGAMPFSVTGGQFINTSVEPAGIVKPTEANKVVIKFRVITDEYKNICNQSTITFTDADGDTKYVFSDDPAQSGAVDPTCFYSAEPLIAMKADKTYENISAAERYLKEVLTGDEVEYTIVVTNTGLINAPGVKLYDAIPPNSYYVPGTTTMNGVAVADVSGAMPFSVSGGASINSSGESEGVVTPGDANKVVIKFKVVSTGRYVWVCNQAHVIFTDAIGNSKIVDSDDPNQSGTQETCFYSYGTVDQGRIAVNGTTNETQANTVQPDLITSVQVRPNPFINDLNLQVQLPTAETIQVRLIDFYGRTVYATSRNVGAGVNSLNVDVPAGLSRGIYVLEVLAGNNRLLSKKLIKQ